jgi:5'-nucleotidase
MTDPRILLTNDDGIDAPGITALAEALGSLGELLVVAPKTEQSATGRSLSYGRGNAIYDQDSDLNFAEEDGYSYQLETTVSDTGYAVSGTPCDCVLAGINGFSRPPDLVVSGCNPGPNLGESVITRSGTVGAAIEAAYHNIPAIAVSTDIDYTDGTFDNAIKETVRIVKWVLEEKNESRSYFNLNVPSTGAPSLSITRPCPNYEMHASREASGFKLTNPMLGPDPNMESDPAANSDRAVFLNRRESSLSPLTLPQTPVEVDADSLSDLTF